MVVNRGKRGPRVAQDRLHDGVSRENGGKYPRESPLTAIDSINSVCHSVPGKAYPELNKQGARRGTTGFGP